MQIIDEGKGLIKMWTEHVPVELEALQQVKNIAAMPFIEKWVAVMPDVHFGKGATVGSVIPTKGAIIPAAVGVDIGCGMMAVRLSLKASDLPDSLAGLRSAIEKAVPHGRTNDGGPGDRGAWGDVPERISNALSYGGDESLYQRFLAIGEKHPSAAGATRPGFWAQAGTLGTGNHFIEVCLDEEQSVWVMLHSGSRGAGNRIGTYFIQKAKEDMRRWFINLPDADLAYIPQGSTLFSEYWRAVEWAQDYARMNRELMMASTLGAIKTTLGRDAISTAQVVNCHHNYIEAMGRGVFLTRKGAVSAKLGELGIIPGSMGVKSFIVRGKGNRDSWFSCSHGAGRKMSRTAARKLFTLEDHAKATAGVECRKDEEVIDETPGAYKDIDAVMASQADLIDIVHTLKQVLCVKG